MVYSPYSRKKTRVFWLWKKKKAFFSQKKKKHRKKQNGGFYYWYKVSKELEGENVEHIKLKELEVEM